MARNKMIVAGMIAGLAWMFAALPIGVRSGPGAQPLGKELLREILGFAVRAVAPAQIGVDGIPIGAAQGLERRPGGVGGGVAGARGCGHRRRFKSMTRRRRTRNR